MISYADSSGGLNILGPKLTKQVTEDFTYEYLKKMKRRTSGKSLLMLCPKTTYALLGTEYAEFREYSLSGPMSYGEGCVEAIGKIDIVGQTCMKNAGLKLKNGKIKEVVLK